ncbi:hypothetical protein [Streptomyces flavidovirens]|uniref:hypothetical protein n=1 Tax=Streptomyces flavidovirens TaxID=67298 RepID=UPI0036988267
MDTNNVRVSGGKMRDPEPLTPPAAKSAKPKRKPLDLSKHPLAKPLNPQPVGGDPWPDPADVKLAD